MIASQHRPADVDSNRLVMDYSKSLHEYTLRLWTESRRKVEQQAKERTKNQAAKEAAERQIN